MSEEEPGKHVGPSVAGLAVDRSTRAEHDHRFRVIVDGLNLTNCPVCRGSDYAGRHVVPEKRSK